MAIKTGTPLHRAAMKKLKVHWPETRCQMCKQAPASGVFWLEFVTYSKRMDLCGRCGLYEAAHRYVGNLYLPSLQRITLICTITSIEEPLRETALVRPKKFWVEESSNDLDR